MSIAAYRGIHGYHKRSPGDLPTLLNSFGFRRGLGANPCYTQAVVPASPPRFEPTVSRTDAIQQFDRRRRFRRLAIAVEAILVLAILWVVGPRIAAIRSALPGIAAALLVLFFWTFAFALELGIFVAVSWDDFRDLVYASLRASAPAMWLAPAVLLLTDPSFVAKGAGLLLVAYSTWSLLSRRTPQKLQPDGAGIEWSRRQRLFRGSMVASYPWFARELLPPILGAVTLETGLFAMVAGRPLLAAPLVALGAALWTWWSIVRGVIARRQIDRPSHWLLSILLILILTMSLSTRQMNIQLAEMQAAEPSADAADPELTGMLEHVWKDLEEPPKPQAPKSKKFATHLAQPRRNPTSREIAAGGEYLAPGVILQPEIPRPKLVFSRPGALRPSSTPAPADRPMNMPFSGEYQIFPTSSARLRHDWALESGNLLDHIYATAAGGSLETEAYQRLDPPIDFTNCGQIRIALVSDEAAPFAVNVQLVGRSGNLDLGSEFCGLDRRTEETVTFRVPEKGDLIASAMRVVFRRYPKQGKESVKVEVRWFTLVPR